MIDALMNGESQTAMIENCSNDQPSNIKKYPIHEELSAHAQLSLSIKADISTKGTGINTSNLYTANIANVNIIFCLIVSFSRTSLNFFKNFGIVKLIFN